MLTDARCSITQMGYVASHKKIFAHGRVFYFVIRKFSSAHGRRPHGVTNEINCNNKNHLQQ